MNELQPVNIEVEVSGIDEATKKAERYVELLKEAKTLADELASKEFEVSIKED
ncbi:hypothetical protein A5819_003443 [Enterococcus sp. 7E2_DIV0204]|uniref:hypothetical protein n=1 Tax=unclassified Enterococcus TaxID=2608891 RepID=UPI000B64A56B|nr:MULTISPECIES: hypothetical protein [unclassified Enterococcus]OTN86593.1 hypothetical protein A5819_003443 [Enterococcus sp. 7E2_DIV0204]OTP47618.1 hypothetical protein A5884_003373 [Enterococcus sp. 7D2_DIV0200]